MPMKYFSIKWFMMFIMDHNTLTIMNFKMKMCLSNTFQFICILRIMFSCCQNYTVSSHNYSYIISVNYGMILVWELKISRLSHKVKP